MENKLSHFDTEGNAIMVDVSEKQETTRTAIASGIIKLGIKILQNMSLVMQSVGGLSDRLFC